MILYEACKQVAEESQEGQGLLCSNHIGDSFCKLCDVDEDQMYQEIESMSESQIEKESFTSVFKKVLEVVERYKRICRDIEEQHHKSP